ncbi:MAG: ImmA/IrrE family metallo-endopeptidase [Planctomycetales bacterium]|nr:ImmA/IrrE family metallo-endopeptidase [Planctomycetales bacterium]
MNNASALSDWISRPGDSLLAAMQRRGVTTTALAIRLTGGMDQLRDIVSGIQPIDPESAQAISEAVGGSAHFWMKRQANYDRDLARAVLSTSPVDQEVWLRSIPAPGPRPRGRLSEETRIIELKRRLEFYGVGTLGAWRGRYISELQATRFRTSQTLTSDDGAISLWLRKGELAASLAETAPWRADALESKLGAIRRLSRISRPRRFLPKVKGLLAEAGVALVVMRAPKGCRASGASRLVRPDRAMIMLSFRFRSDEQFWFTLFHEIGHLILHGDRSFVDEDVTSGNTFENEANDFAASLVIPPEKEQEFAELKIKHQFITRFAVSAEVAPGLVLGQLQHRGRVARNRLNSLKRTWPWDEIDQAISTL